MLWHGLRRTFTAAILACLTTIPAGAQQRRSAGAGGGLPPRDEWQRVPEIMAALRIGDGQRIADIAAGQGYLTRHLATRLGKSGRVFAVEIDSAARQALAALADSLPNIEVVAGTDSDPRLPGQVDGAVV